MPFKKLLMENETIAAGAERRLLPGLDVSRWDRLHFHIGARARGIGGLSVRILFATAVEHGAILADSTIWYEDTTEEREFSHKVAGTYSGTGFAMSVPVIAPILYDVILKNEGSADLTDLSVGLLAQEI